MKEKSQSIFRTIYYILNSTALAVAALSLMVACLSIYNRGAHPFTPEIVAAHLIAVSVPLGWCLLMLLVGAICHPLLPTRDESDREMDRPLLARLQKQVVLKACPKPLSTKILLHRVLRLALYIVTGWCLTVGTVAFGIYGINAGSTTLVEILTHFAVMWLCLGFPLLLGIATGYITRISRKAEAKLLKTAPEEAKQPLPEAKAAKSWPVWIVWGVLAVVALACIVGGLLCGGWMDVLTKAINICTECIGLG